MQFSQKEFELLSQPQSSSSSKLHHELNTAPLMSRDALVELGFTKRDADTQFGVLGQIIGIQYVAWLPTFDKDLTF